MKTEKGYIVYTVLQNGELSYEDIDSIRLFITEHGMKIGSFDCENEPMFLVDENTGLVRFFLIKDLSKIQNIHSVPHDVYSELDSVYSMIYKRRLKKDLIKHVILFDLPEEIQCLNG